MPTLTGAVEDGYGRASDDVATGVYAPVAGTLHPGSLNLRLGAFPPVLPAPAATVRFAGIDRHLWPANVAGRFVWVLHAAHLGPVVELLADVHLRDLFGLTNGDQLKVTL